MREATSAGGAPREVAVAAPEGLWTALEAACEPEVLRSVGRRWANGWLDRLEDLLDREFDLELPEAHFGAFLEALSDWLGAVGLGEVDVSLDGAAAGRLDVRIPITSPAAVPPVALIEGTIAEAFSRLASRPLDARRVGAADGSDADLRLVVVQAAGQGGTS